MPSEPQDADQPDRCLLQAAHAGDSIAQPPDPFAQICVDRIDLGRAFDLVDCIDFRIERVELLIELLIECANVFIELLVEGAPIFPSAS